METQSSVQLYAWRNRVLSARGPSGATTRFVLLALSTYMTPKKTNAHPGINTLAEATGLCERSVVKHLLLARTAGWIRVRRMAGKLWKRNKYFLALPSSEPGSGEGGSREPNYEDHLQEVRPKSPRKNPLQEASGSTAPGSREGGAPDGGTPDVALGSLDLDRIFGGPEVPPADSSEQSGPIQGEGPSRPVAEPGGASSIALDQLAWKLAEVFPVQRIPGRPVQRPAALMVERWLIDAVGKGDLLVEEYPKVLAAAEKRRAIAEQYPEAWGVKLKTWIKDGGWTEELEAEGGGKPRAPTPSNESTGWTPPAFTKRKKLDLNAARENTQGNK